MLVKNRDIFATKMTAEQIAEAQRRAREWDAAHPRDSPPSPLNCLPAHATLGHHGCVPLRHLP